MANKAIYTSAPGIHCVPGDILVLDYENEVDGDLFMFIRGAGGLYNLVSLETGNVVHNVWHESYYTLFSSIEWKRITHINEVTLRTELT